MIFVRPERVEKSKVRHSRKECRNLLTSYNRCQSAIQPSLHSACPAMPVNLCLQLQDGSSKLQSNVDRQGGGRFYAHEIS